MDNNEPQEMKMDRNEIKQVLEGCEFFKGLQEPYIKNIIGLCRVRNYEPGEYVKPRYER